jgi:phage terminase small subunit
MRAWWVELVAEHQFETHQLLVLQAACQAWDRMEAARGELAKHGLSYTDAKGMIRARPEASIEQQARIAFLRAVRELNLQVEPPKGSGLSPPALFR